MNMKFIKVFCILIATTIDLLFIGKVISVFYKWDKFYYSHWLLAEKASTLEAKAEHIDAFVGSLSKVDMRGRYAAIIFKTPNNSMEKNYDALKTLQARLKEAKSMDKNSMAYQMAIQQITAQEQGEGGEMISVMKNGWVLANGYWYAYPDILMPLGVICIILAIALLSIPNSDEWE